MRNRRRLKRKLRVVSRLVKVLAGFFILMGANGIPLSAAIVDAVVDTGEVPADAQSEAKLPESAQDGCYTVKINELVFNLKTEQDVIKVLSAAKERYDTKDEYEIRIVKDENRVLPAFTAILVKRQTDEDVLKGAGAERVLHEAEKMSGKNEEGAEEAFKYGLGEAENVEKYGYDADIPISLCDIGFSDKVEIAKTGSRGIEITPIEEAIESVTQDRVREQIYEVQPGDTLSLISLKTDVPVDDLVAINDTLENENSVIRAGDELIITVPEPELGFVHQERKYYEENFNAEVQYVDNDAWYTNQTKLLQDPVAGYHKVVADISFRNDSEEDRIILKEQIIMEPIPKIVERGTKIPPTFLKPISGGRVSSPFGKRSAPKKGASTYHKGIDWATPIGTVVVASSGGVVSRAGWGSGYGNVVYIDHPDGRQTRYGHLSKVLVKPGDRVSMGQKIALSGNTGRSTGPHLHFEILVNGAAVNPMSVMN